MKHIAKLADRQLITVEHTSYIDDKGMKWNSNNRYTILPVRDAMDCCYQRQMLLLDEQQTWRQVQQLLGQRAKKALPDPR